MPISWMRSADVDPAADFPPTDYVTFDGEELIGRVYRISHGPGEGRWFWTMTATRPKQSSTGCLTNEVALCPASATAFVGLAAQSCLARRS
jgi:hypothetical protein